MKITVYLDSDLKKQIDILANSKSLSRSSMIKFLCKTALWDHFKIPPKHSPLTRQ